ncbi:hypothetical protein KL930_004945 [Ogataea haglerorum]|uniref:Uncharacterized protein n=1 Tax=Ogataea haglerorum TaxID=1937702 RepID=A0AAN6D8Y5_9ASCO|nr:uncharacterized protein KL911_004935 [Ogataea haglerorum]KAG7692311.1 hypothetical protein KL915_004742 [Ogataea haglerorum]KAG7699836.1 hypothetical protein KL951_001553 [Ogataea haglerorum]KAG7703112.1 hypothetical protein KL914_004893 [Ogataea haglerorum]KAG7703235.1 hypothetical protein KL950_004869 [Ogataea haglerorum]KAG7714766.1 hypothetical protein KL949_004602 [Ogataea haglerorum]
MTWVGTTIVFAKKLPEGLSFGIDFFFFDFSNEVSFQGIKQVTNGVHLVHLTNQLSNTRTAKFVKCQDREVISIDVVEGELTVESISVENQLVFGRGRTFQFEALLPYMVNYSNIENNKWPQFGLHLDYSQIVSVESDWTSELVTTSDSSTAELLELRKVIEFDMNRQNGELRLTQTNPKAVLKAVKLDLSKYSRDKSDYFTALFTTDRFTNEHNFCFVGLLVLNNFCCLEQWYSLTMLALECVDLVAEQAAFFERFIENLQSQLEQIASHTEEFVKVSRLKTSLKVFLTNMEVFPYSVQFRYASLLRFIETQFSLSITYQLDEQSESEDESFEE